MLTSVWASRRKNFHSKSRCERNVALLPADVTFGLLSASRLLIEIYRKQARRRFHRKWYQFLLVCESGDVADVGVALTANKLAAHSIYQPVCFCVI